MSYYIVHNNSKSLKHAAPYSTPNSGKRLLARWTAKNLRVFQETPGNVNSGIFASFDLVNANNPKEKTYNMQFSFADGTSADKNIIARIRRFFNDAYNRQRSYGFPELTEMEKQQIVAKINTAYNQWSGFSHSLQHSANPYPYRPDVKLDGNQLVITFTDVTNNRTATLSVNLVGVKNYKDVENRLDNLLQAAYNDGKDWANISKNAFDSIMRQARALNIFNDKTVSNRYRNNKLSHSVDEPDVIDCTSDQDDYLEHHGILGMKWGIRRYQNPDGSLTDAGKYSTS